MVTFPAWWQAAWARTDSVGFAIVEAPALAGDVTGAPIKIGVWYPSDGKATDHDLGLRSQRVVMNGPVVGNRLKLVVISHGTGGSLEDHADTAFALARAGFVVAALQHPHDNYLDKSRSIHSGDRPRAVHVVIDYMLAEWPAHDRINASRIGLFGFSAGGLTALLTAGGIPDLSLIPRYCASHETVFLCQLIKGHQDEPATALPPEAEIVDKRIRSMVVVAPAIGFAFTRAGLSNVQIPVQLWQAAKDRILPGPDYVEPIRDRLPRRPEYHLVAGADHLDFLAPCSPELAHRAQELCTESGHFNRAKFHQRFNAAVVAFFRRTLR